MKRIGSILALGILLIGIGSCADTKKAEKFADNFFKLLKAKNYSTAANMISRDVLDSTDYNEKLKKYCNDPVLGKFVSAKKNMGFNTKINNGITTVELPYEVTFENEVRNSTVTLIDKGDGFKVLSIQ